MMNKLVIFVLLAVLAVSACGQRVPKAGRRVPKDGVVQRSDRYVKREVPKLLRGVVVNYARIGTNASKGSRVPKPEQGNRVPLELPKELSATGSQNMFANLTSDKFDTEPENSATGSKTGATGGKTGATGATGATGPVVTKKTPVFTGPTGVESSIEHERKLRLVKANLTKNNTAKDDAANDVKKRLDDKNKKEKAKEVEKREAEKADEADKALKNRIREVEGKPAPVVPTKAINNGKNNLKNASVTGKSSDSKNNSSKNDSIENRSNDSTENRSRDEVDEVILKERIKRGEIKLNITEKKKKVFVQKGAAGATGGTGLPAVDLNKANFYDPTLDGLPKQYAWIKNGRMGSIVYRQFKKLKASNNYQSHLLNNVHTQRRL